MILEQVSANAFTYGFGLKVYLDMKCIDKGMELQSQIVKQGIEKDVFNCNSLVEMYTQCESLSKAKGVSLAFKIPNVVFWNIVIVGHVDHGLGKDALMLHICVL